MPKTSLTPEPPEPLWLKQLRNLSAEEFEAGFDHLDKLRDREELETNRKQVNAYRKGIQGDRK